MCDDQCEWVAGCDGYHGVSRQSIPEGKLQIYDKAYPYAWLGILTRTAPCHHELIYANHDHGFALASMRSDTLSR